MRVKMCVALGCGGLAVTKQFPDDRKAEPAACANTGVSVPQIMNANANKPSALLDQRPRPLQIGAGFSRIVPGNDEFADVRQLGKQGQGSAIQHNGLLAGL